MTLTNLQAEYPSATITSTRSAASYQDTDLQVSIRCQVDEGGVVTAAAMQNALDNLARMIARLKGIG